MVKQVSTKYQGMNVCFKWHQLWSEVKVVIFIFSYFKWTILATLCFVFVLDKALVRKIVRRVVCTFHRPKAFYSFHLKRVRACKYKSRSCVSRFWCYNKRYFKRLKLQSLVTSLQLFLLLSPLQHTVPCLGVECQTRKCDIGVMETIIRLPYCLLRCRFKNDECALIVPEPAFYCFVNLMKWGIRASFALSALQCKRNARLMQHTCIMNEKWGLAMTAHREIQ